MGLLLTGAGTVVLAADGAAGSDLFALADVRSAAGDFFIS